MQQGETVSCLVLFHRFFCAFRRSEPYFNFSLFKQPGVAEYDFMTEVNSTADLVFVGYISL